MSTPVIYNPEVEVERVANWSGFGAHLYREEIALQNVRVELPPCTEVAHLDAAIEAHKLAKSVLADLIARRKSTTTVLDQLSSRLMESEKALAATIDAFAATILTVKRAKEAADLAAQAVNDERIAITLQCQQFRENAISRIRKAIIDGSVVVLENALKNGTKPADIAKWIAIYPFRADKFSFVPPAITPRHISMDELRAIIAQHAWYDSTAFATEWDEALERQFSDYEVSFSNATAAMERAKAEAAKAAADEELRKAQANAANTLIVSASPVLDSAPKATIKRTYVISMPDTYEGAVVIMKAFFANAAACRSHLRVKSFLKLGVDNMCVALAALKNSDHAFAPEGIVWGEKEK
jgi:hypothetical protein